MPTLVPTPLSREHFEERVFSRYFRARIKLDKRTGQHSLQPDTLTKAELCTRVGDDYKDESVSAMWWGYSLAMQTIGS